MLKAHFMENIASLYCFELKERLRLLSRVLYFFKGLSLISHEIRIFPNYLGDDMWIVLKKSVIFLYYNL